MRGSMARHSAQLAPQPRCLSMTRLGKAVLGAAKVKLELGLSLTPASCAVCGRGAQGDHVLG